MRYACGADCSSGATFGDNVCLSLKEVIGHVENLAERALIIVGYLVSHTRTLA